MSFYSELPKPDRTKIKPLAQQSAKRYASYCGKKGRTRDVERIFGSSYTKAVALGVQRFFSILDKLGAETELMVFIHRTQKRECGVLSKHFDLTE